MAKIRITKRGGVIKMTFRDISPKESKALLSSLGVVGDEAPQRCANVKCTFPTSGGNKFCSHLCSAIAVLPASMKG